MTKSVVEEAPSAGSMLAKRVQDMVLQGEEPAKPYICRKDNDDSSVLAEIPTIDLSLLTASPFLVDSEELHRLRSALCSWGCFQAVGHGISSSFLDKMREVARKFFEQPIDVKKQLEKGVTEFDGYGGDPVPEEGQPLDWQDRLFLKVFLEDTQKLHLWPENPPSFREVVVEYTEKLKLMAEVVSKAMARCLDLEENCFLNQFGERSQFDIRLNYYSPCQRPDLVLGLKAHADGSGYTLILQDEVQGLQVLKDGRWLTVPTNPQALLVLMGDQMEIMTNGIFKSPVHRVLSNAEKERISIAMFYTPEIGKEIHPEDSLINDKPRLYKPVKDYADTHWGYYQKGQRAIHIAKV